MRRTKAAHSLVAPAIVAGEWRGEIVGKPTLNLGQTTSEGPPIQVVEFTHLMLSVMLRGPTH